MANNRMTEGVGKKIVEALKMQADDVDIESANEEFSQSLDENENESAVMESSDSLNFSEEDLEERDSENYEPGISEIAVDDEFSTTDNAPTPNLNDFNQAQNFNNQMFDMHLPKSPVQEISEFEVPSNVAVLKQLISKLPAGVTKQTGAMIIKQTMEALGISMKSVLQEAQQVQESLNNSSRECQASIMEYKKQIGLLEKQAQKYQRQYSALNDIISLFIQTNY